jgi:hypothetical protein
MLIILPQIIALIFNLVYMAIIFCPQCGTKVSSTSNRCYNCSFLLSTIEVKNNDIEKSDSGLIIAGYIFAFLALFIFPIIFMLVGIVFGIINLSKNQTLHGILQIFFSLIFGIIGSIIGAVVWTLFHL